MQTEYNYGIWGLPYFTQFSRSNNGSNQQLDVLEMNKMHLFYTSFLVATTFKAQLLGLLKALAAGDTWPVLAAFLVGTSGEISLQSTYPKKLLTNFNAEDTYY